MYNYRLINISAAKRTMKTQKSSPDPSHAP
jgi:hypothetical protein